MTGVPEHNSNVRGGCGSRRTATPESQPGGTAVAEGIAGPPAAGPGSAAPGSRGGTSQDGKQAAPAHGDAGGNPLQDTMASEIIPRLVLSCRSSIAATPPLPVPGDAGVREFAGYLIAEEADEANRYLESVRRQGMALEDIYLDLFAPAAHYLGYLWEEDIYNIVQVTLGVGRLQQMVRQLSPEFQKGQPMDDPRRRVLLLPIPGEQHTFGLTLMSEFFQRANWQVWGWPLVEEGELMKLVREQQFAVIGITVGGEVSLTGLKSLIRDIRRTSGNPAVGVMVGGPIFVRQPQLTRQVGADATAVDARQAVVQAEALLELASGTPEVAACPIASNSNRSSDEER